MENYQRFQILSSTRQDLFQPDSPIWVSRCQLSRDMESGNRLLQARMVNCSERTVRQVFLRIVCLGPNRERLTQLEMVPMQSLSILPGRVFGDDKLVEVPVGGTVYTEVFAQRVRFTDDTVWDETDPDGYLAFKAVPVRPEDRHAETLAERARSKGVRNDCYFRSQQGLWVCTCGMPNPTRGLRCVRCGADRLWLEKHMDPNLIDAPAPVKKPEPAPAAAPAPVSISPVTVIPTPIRTEAPAQPTIIVQSVPEPEPEEAPPSHAGRNAAIIFGVLLFLALGAFFVWRYLKPYLRYQEALRARAAGDYDQAVALFEDLEAYRDSPDQIIETLSRKAVGLMDEGKYQEALSIWETLEGYDKQVADCLYAMGVTAYNENDPETALRYVEQLRERFPNYDKTETLAQYSYFSLGNQAFEQAAQVAEDPFLARDRYETAKEYYQKAPDNQDSASRIQACDYQIAKTYRAEGLLEDAIEAFGALGSYEDAAVQRQACMFEYVQQHVDDFHVDSYAPAYLEELVTAGYPGAQELLDRLSGVGFSFEIRIDNPDGTDAETVTDLSKVAISYSVEQRDADGAVLVLVRYSLPDGTVGRTLLNMNHEASGVKRWTDFPFPTNCTQKGVVTVEFFDAARGETEDALLESLTFPYEYRPPEENGTPDAGSDGQSGSGSNGKSGSGNDGQSGSGKGEGNTDPSESTAPGTGRGG